MLEKIHIMLADDDLIYPPDYINKLIGGCEKYNACKFTWCGFKKVLLIAIIMIEWYFVHLEL